MGLPWEQWVEQMLMIWWWLRLMKIYQPVQETVILAQAACIDLHVADWVTAQQEDLILRTMIDWISGQKVQDLKQFLGGDEDTEDSKSIL